MIILLLLFLPKVYLKTKKMTDISQTQAGFQGKEPQESFVDSKGNTA